jgi:DNA-directed RNA polymerase specialized sigma24 family protein
MYPKRGMQKNRDRHMALIMRNILPELNNRQGGISSTLKKVKGTTEEARDQGKLLTPKAALDTSTASYHNAYPGIDPRITSIIAFEAAKLPGRYRLTWSDLPDIEQEIHIAVWSGMESAKVVVFEAAVHQITDSRIKDLIRYRERACRDWEKEAYSLDGVPWYATNPLDEPIDTPPDTEDLKEALASLPGDLRELAEVLVDCDGNVSEAARVLGHPRKKTRIAHERLKRRLTPLKKKGGQSNAGMSQRKGEA